MALKQRLVGYMEPWFLITYSVFYLLYTQVTSPFLFLSSPTAFRAKWFDNFWRFLGPRMAASPLQVDHIDSLLTRAHGIVLELGPGGGDQMYHFKSVASGIERIYGAEPNAFLHPKLLEKAAEVGLGGRYTAIEAGAQPGSLLPALKKAGFIASGATGLPEEGIFDTIITVKSLCSAPQTQLPATVAVIQALLKPGGEFLFFEHLGNNTDQLTQMYAWVIDWIWPALMGGCRLDGNLDKVLLGMGGWEKRDLKTTGQFKGYEVFRYMKGVCRKA